MLALAAGSVDSGSSSSGSGSTPSSATTPGKKFDLDAIMNNGLGPQLLKGTAYGLYVTNWEYQSTGLLIVHTSLYNKSSNESIAETISNLIVSNLSYPGYNGVTMISIRASDGAELYSRMLE